jgi:hypothetical protein
VPTGHRATSAGDRRAGGRDEGSASILMIGVTVMVGLLLTLVLVVAAVVAARQRAGAAADLAALAAAAVGEVPAGADPGSGGPGSGSTGADPAPGGLGPGRTACAEAEVVARVNRVRLTGCQVRGDGSVRVDVRATFRCGRWHGSVGGAARAGRVLRFRPSL